MEITYDELVTFVTVVFKAKRRLLGDCFATASEMERMLRDPLAWLNHAGAEFRFVFGENVQSVFVDHENKIVDFG